MVSKLRPEPIVVLVIAFLCVSFAFVPANASDFTLEIFGNANMDDTIDELDIEYVQGIIDWTNDETELADANYDGKVDEDDITQIELIIRGEEKEITIIDSAGSIVTVSMPIERIVVFQSGAIEIMRSLKAKDKIVGVTGYVIENNIFYPEFGDFANIGSLQSPNYEEILNCEPDVVFLYGTFSLGNCEAIENKLKELDPSITMVHFDCFKIESYIDEVKLMGYILNRETEADTYVDFYECWINTIKERVEGEDRPKVYFEGRTNPYSTGGLGTSWHMSVEKAGGNNIFSDLSDYFEVDAEEVVSRNPDIIIKMHKGGYDIDDLTELSDLRDELMNRPELVNVNAVKNGQVYIAAWDIVDRAHNVGIAYMAKWFYPDLFEDLDPKEIHQRYLTEFQELDYDLDEHNIFAYPPLKS